VPPPREPTPTPFVPLSAEDLTEPNPVSNTLPQFRAAPPSSPSGALEPAAVDTPRSAGVLEAARSSEGRLSPLRVAHTEDRFASAIDAPITPDLFTTPAPDAVVPADDETEPHAPLDAAQVATEGRAARERNAVEEPDAQTDTDHDDDGALAAHERSARGDGGFDGELDDEPRGVPRPGRRRAAYWLVGSVTAAAIGILFVARQRDAASLVRPDPVSDRSRAASAQTSNGIEPKIEPAATSVSPLPPSPGSASSSDPVSSTPLSSTASAPPSASAPDAVAPGLASAEPSPPARDPSPIATQPTPTPTATPKAPALDPGGGPAGARALTHQAQRSLERNAVGRAIELARRATQADPGDAEAWLTLGAAYDAAGNASQARKAYRQCVDRARPPRVAECRALLVD
jgi:tetratricopeptide (TPR) repeat protein